MNEHQGTYGNYEIAAARAVGGWVVYLVHQDAFRGSVVVPTPEFFGRDREAAIADAKRWIDSQTPEK